MRRTVTIICLIAALSLPVLAVWRHCPGVRRVAGVVLSDMRAGGPGANTLTLQPLRAEPLPAGTVEVGTANPEKVIGEFPNE
jgi:hypothetical protein